VLTAVIVGLSASHAGASLSNGTVTLKVGSSVATNPLADQQSVTVAVAPNSTLDRSSLAAAGFPSGAVAIKILECSDAGGQTANLPTKSTQCEPSTIDAGATLEPDGSVLDQGYTVYALPDPNDLGVSNGTVCDSQHQCVLGIFSNQNDYTKPHVFSAPFEVTPAATNGGTTASSTPSTSPTSSTTGGAQAGVSVPAATLADTGAPSVWPWLLGAGFILLVGGTALRFFRRPRHEGRR